MLRFLRRFFGSSAFIVELREGKARCVKGKLLDRMLSEFSEVARQHGLAVGTVLGKRGSAGIRLRFSKEIPSASHQQFRNIWNQFS